VAEASSRTAIVTGAARGIRGGEGRGRAWTAHARVASTTPVGRVGHPDDIAHTASSLVSAGAGYVSGQVIYVAGGPRT
jgi:NAD(P)-dependent dehydrogenase (short-subunit alcohol dehydrogenase family)